MREFFSPWKAHLLLVVGCVLRVVEAGLGQLNLPLVVADEVLEVGKDLLLVVVIPDLRCFFVLVLQSQGVQLGAVRKLRPL